MQTRKNLLLTLIPALIATTLFSSVSSAYICSQLFEPFIAVSPDAIPYQPVATSIKANSPTRFQLAEGKTIIINADGSIHAYQDNFFLNELGLKSQKVESYKYVQYQFLAVKMVDGSLQTFRENSFSAFTNRFYMAEARIRGFNLVGASITGITAKKFVVAEGLELYITPMGTLYAKKNGLLLDDVGLLDTPAVGFLFNSIDRILSVYLRDGQVVEFDVASFEKFKSQYSIKFTPK